MKKDGNARRCALGVLLLLILWPVVRLAAADDTNGAKANPVVTWDSKSLIVDGRRVVPVMGEIHYSRLPADEWATEVRKMK